MKKILLPIDLSYNSLKSLNIAVDIAKKNNAEINLLNSYVMPKIFGEEASFSTPYPVMRLKNRIQENLIHSIQSKTEKVIQDAGLRKWDWRDDIIIKPGNAQDVILDEIDASKIGLLVMETRSKNSMKESTTYNVLKRSKVPVLAIPSSSDEKRKINNIVYSTDLTHSDSEALGKLADLAQLYDAEITFLHIGNRDDSKFITNRKNHKLNKLLLKTPYKKNKKSYKLIYADSALEGLNRFISVMNTNLVAMTTHTQSFLQTLFHESLTKLVLKNSNIPVLTFNEDNISSFDKSMLHKSSPITANLF